MPTPESLYDALSALRASTAPLTRVHDAHWKVVESWLRVSFPGRGAENEEAHQETLIAIGRNVQSMQASVPLQAVRWVKTIHQRKKVDLLRARSRNPVLRGLEKTSSESRVSEVEQLESQGDPSLDPEAAERIVSIVEAQVEIYLRSSDTAPSMRHLKRLQSRAALRRLVLEADFDELCAALATGEPMTRDRVYKWVERGRAVVLAALDDWVSREGATSMAADVASALREIIGKRRSDQGRARPLQKREG
jgi:hypothetical protein